ncbi:MAG: hypothetical protein SNJ78_09350 [Spirochaetales bacterium]
MKNWSWFFIIIPMVFLGCLQTETKILLQKDGSGIIEQQVLVRKDIVEMMQQMQAALQGSLPPQTTSSGVYNEGKLKEDASRMGQGVRFVQSRPVTTPAGEGYQVRYAFTDINTLQVPETPLPEDTILQQPGGLETNSGRVSFQFTKGNPATLRVFTRKLEHQRQKDSKAEEEGKEDEEAESEEDKAMVQELLRDMKVSLKIEVSGTITSTNADFRSGNQVTILNLDFNSIFENPEALEILMQNKINSLEELKAFSRRYPGLQMETKEQIQIQFR